MTIRIRMLAAAGAIALPAALAAQATSPDMQPPVPDPAGAMQTPPQTPPGEPGLQMPPTPGEPTDMPGSQAGATTPATAADLQAGATVYDTQGAMVGTIESADAGGAVVSTGMVRARLPLSSFARGGNGLVIAMTRSQLEAAARAQSPGPDASPDQPPTPPDEANDPQTPPDEPN